MESLVIPGHCRRFALSDSKCSDYLEACNHIHDVACDRCSLTLQPEELDGLKFNTEQARRNINAWKAHLLRLVNQDEARINVISLLSPRLGHEVSS